ncbi:MAG TPA: hypothetical protein VF177_23920, partial [Anaerolineae bacterium]
SPSNSASNYATIKYDANGNELWIRTYNGPNNFNDTPYALAVSAAGDVVVTGESTGGVSSFDIATIRYDTNGNELWVRRYNSPSDGQDSGNDVAFGANGEVYVGGHSVQNDFLDFTLIKYDVGGNEVWVRTFDGTRQWGDSIRRVGVDSQGNVVVTGYSQNMELGTVIATLKYDSNGNLLWQQLFDDPTGEDIPWGLAIGPDDAIYVTGDAGSDVGTVAYDANGNERWSVIYNNGTDRGYNVALDSENNVYVVGQEPIVTIRYTQTAGPEPTATPTSAATAAPTDTPVPIDTPEPTATLTATPSPTPEPTNTPTATATPGSATTIHVGDLDGASVNDGKTWIAYVTITIHDNNHNPVSNATVSGSWGNGASGSASCATNGSGQCTVSVSGIRKNVSSVTFTVNNVSHSTLSYDSGANHDPDGDSNGTSITISRS